MGETKWFDMGRGRKFHYSQTPRNGRSLCGKGFFHAGARYLNRTPSVDWQCKICRRIKEEAS